MYKWIFYLIFFLFPFQTYSQSIDSLLKELHAFRKNKNSIALQQYNDTSLINLFNKISSTYITHGIYDLALLYVDSAQIFSKKIGYKKGTSFSYYNIGQVYYNQGDYGKATEYYTKYLNTSKEINDMIGIANANLGIGNVYSDQGIYGKASGFYFKSLKIFEDLKDKHGISASNNNIGNAYMYQGDYENAILYYFKSLKIKLEIKEILSSAYSYNNIGGVYYYQGIYDKANEYFFKAMKIFETIGDKRGIAGSYNNIGLVFNSAGNSTFYNDDKSISKEKYNKAKDFYKKSLKISEELGDKSSIVLTQANLTDVFIQLKEYTDASLFNQQGLLLSLEIGYKEGIRTSYNTLSQLDSIHNLPEQSYRHFVLAKQYNDSLFNDENEREMGKAVSHYEIQKVEHEQDQEAKITAMKLDLLIKRRNNLQYGGIALGILVLFMSGFIFGRKHLRPSALTFLNLFSLLVLFEFVMLLINPLVEQFTGGIPYYKVSLNIAIALLIFPLHNWIEKRFSAGEMPATKIHSHFKTQTLIVFIFALLSVFRVSVVNSIPQNTDLTSYQTIDRKMVKYANLVSTYRDSCVIFRVKKEWLTAREYYRKFTKWDDSLKLAQRAGEITKIEEKNRYKIQKLEEEYIAKEQVRLKAEKKNRTDMLQFSVISIVIITLFLFLFMTGRMNLSYRIRDELVFVVILILFETIVTATDPLTDTLSMGFASIKFGCNVVIATSVVPVHRWIEEKIKKMAKLKSK